MFAYFLKFEDLEEGKIYENEAKVPSPHVAPTKYKIVDGLLWVINDNIFSIHNLETISRMRFKEIYPIPEEEKKLLSLIDDKFKWIAKDYDGSVWVYTHRPIKEHAYWEKDKGEAKEINSSLFAMAFDFLTWKTRNPSKIQEILERYDKI